ncbi:hypothetical protein E4U41_003774, partial [Claviceps citrina]
PRTGDGGGDGGARELRGLLAETLPGLSGTPAREDASWAGPAVAVAHVLGGWFVVGDSEAA